MKSIKKLTITILAFGIGSITLAFAGGTTGPCTPPEGKIEIQPSQKCNGKYTFGIGKKITLTATELKDKDCYCGREVQDSIDTTTGVKWSIQSGVVGSFIDGNTGTPKTWTAAKYPISDLKFTLELDDKGPSGNPDAYDDGGFTQVNVSDVFDVVIPNKVTTQVTPAPCDNFMPLSPYGKIEDLRDTVNRQGCFVDFSDTYIFERLGAHNVDDGCNIFPPGGPTTETPPSKIKSNPQNQATDNPVHMGIVIEGNDSQYICSDTDLITGAAANCVSSSQTTWAIQDPTQQYATNIFYRTYTFYASNPAKFSTLSFGRSVSDPF